MLCHWCVGSSGLGFVVEYMRHWYVDGFARCRIKFPDECNLWWIRLELAENPGWFVTATAVDRLLAGSA